ncbi:1077_t:CDS:2, partial [Racocetra persica]
VPFTVNTITIFPKIKSLISRYLRPNVVQFLVGQMKESVFYISFCSNIEEIQNMPMNKPSESDNFENEPDCVFLCAQFLLQQLDCSNIKEAARFNMQLINMRWIPKIYQNDVITELDYYGQRFVNDIVASDEDQELNYNQHFKWLQPLNNNNDNEQSTQDAGFINEQLSQQVDSSEDKDSDKENTLPNIKLRNPKKIITRGRPKLSSH